MTDGSGVPVRGLQSSDSTDGPLLVDSWVRDHWSEARVLLKLHLLLLIDYDTTLAFVQRLHFFLRFKCSSLFLFTFLSGQIVLQSVGDAASARNLRMLTYVVLSLILDINGRVQLISRSPPVTVPVLPPVSSLKLFEPYRRNHL